jgi:cytochrome oxidase Cu insertion factor (SCO1/SenC/PrrC family)
MNSKIFTRLVFCALFICATVALVGSAAAGGGAAQAQTTRRKSTAAPKAVTYACPMHPEVTSKKRGRCPKCGMNLVVQRKDAPSPATAATSAGASEALKPGETAAVKLKIPDTTVIDQHGRKLNFYQDLVKGKTVAINFIFTTCTTICPPLTATFRRVQQTLGERVGRDVQLISISVDPTTDVPERLKAFSEKFKAGPGWSFVTGSKQDIDKLLVALGGYAADKNDHTPLILIGNDNADFWTRSYGLAPAAQIVGLVNDAASKSAAGADAQPETSSISDTASEYFPNLELLTQDNKPVRFYNDLLKGKVVLINFLFTTCQGVCSPMTANMVKVQNYLGERVGREVNIISISVDPLTDTPAVLKKYADSFKTQPGWYFLTGDKKNVDWVLYKLGGYVEDKQQHSSILIIGNETTGEWMKVPAMSNPTEIANAVVKLLAPPKEGN